MVCVDKDHNPEFRSLAKRLNLNDNILEQIIHKYYRESGQEDVFPSDIYINAQLGNTEYIEPLNEVRKFWQVNYKEPIVFNSKEKQDWAWSEATNFFPKEAIVRYKDADGNFVLRVRKPVEKLSLASGELSPVYDAEGNMIPIITEQDERDYELISRQMILNSEKSVTFAPAMTQELNQKVLSNLEQTLQLDRYEGRSKGNAGTDSQGNSSANVGLLGESQAIIKGRDSSLRATEEQGVLTKKQIKQRNSEDKAALTELAKKQGRWRDNVDERLEEDLGKMIGHGAEAFVYRIPDGPVIKARTIDPDVEGGYESIEEALASIEIHNRLFPETAMKVVGYGESDGEFNIILEQPYIDGRFATDEEIEQFIKERFNAEKDPSVIGDTSYKTAAYLMQDLKNKNVIVKDGKLYVIDGDFYLTDQHKQYLRLQEKIKEDAKPKPKQPSKKERQVIGPQPFTFNDGTTVTVPFKPNEQQAEALNAMNDFLNSNETTMTLSGYAGTGKTSLMEIIAQKAKRQHKPIMFSATTNKAAAVLKSRVAKAGFDAQTLNKVFGINVEVDSSKAYNARNLVTALKEAQVFPGTTVVIDEASMINEENYGILNRIARENGLKIIYVGDKAQLAPVNETQVSKVFRNTEGRVVELTQVERTDDNAILKEATNIRNGLPLSGESSFNERGEGVGYLTPKSRDEIGKVIRHYIQGLKDNPNFFRILAWQNKTVTAYNDYVRTLFGYTDYIPHVEEPLTGYANWGWNDRTRGYRFINSEAYKVTKVGSPQKTSISIDGKTYEMEYVPVTAENSMGEIDTYNYMDIRGNQENLRVAKILAQKKTELWDKWRHTVGREAKTNIRLQINAIDQFLFVNDKIEDTSRTLPDGSHPLLQQKVVDFGYALTVHKSQGSTFTHVMMDEMDIAKSEKNNAANSQELYKGEDRWVAPEDQQTSISDEINLGIDEYETKPQTTPNASATATNPNAANVRQQLEYVAVSRATDTVTIISNNVKKEDSPLNHVRTANSTPSTTSQPTAIENTPKPADQMNRRELWEHLESLTEPMGERPISYTPVGKTRQKYIVKDGKIYNKKGEEVHYQGKDVNRILANLAVAEDRGVVVTYRDKDYVVDNHQTITSVTSGDIMKWGAENGDRKAIIQLAEQKFRTLIENRQNRLSEMVPELMDLLKAQGINIHDKAAMEKFLKENPQWSTKIQQFIGKKARTQFEQQLMKARPDMATPGYTVDGINFIKDPFSDDFIPNRLDAVTAQRLQKEGVIKEGVFSEWALTDKGKEMAQVSHPEIDATLDFLHSLEDNKENTAYIKTAIRWIANRSLTLPQDHTKAYQAFELARKKHLDLQKYNTLGELITAPEMQPKKKEKVPFNPDKAKTFSNKRTVTTEGGRVFTVYDVENTEEGQREVCKALAAHYGMSPWCLSTFTTTGEPTESARKFWAEYSGVKRRIAFENGKPVAFSSDHESVQPRSWLTVAGKRVPEALWVPNMLMQNQTDGIGKKEFEPETLEYLLKNGYIERNSAYDWVINDDAYKLTEKGEQAIGRETEQIELEDREAWWDMEDTHPQAFLSDSIVSEYKTPEQQEQAIEAARNEALQEQYEEYLRTGFPEPVNPDQEEISDLPFFMTPEGEIYGFADQKGDLYFDEDKVSPNIQIHEYTHLWDRAVAQRNPKLWKRGVDLMKQTSLWNEVLNDANYGQKWETMKGMTPEKMESLIASEVHSRLTGTQGEALLNRIAKEKGSKGIVAKLKQWMLDFWKELKGTFSNWSDEEINNLTLDDFNKMTIRDLVDKVNLKEQQSPQQSIQQGQQQKVPASYEGMITPDANTVFVFGSNPEGIHGAGAAKVAKDKFGAIQGQGEGMQGNAYALPTKDLDKAKGTRWYRPGPKEETEVKEWYKSHDYSEVQNHPLNTERTMTPQQIIESIKKLYDTAHQNPDKQFKVSHYPFGELSLNGYLGEEMLAMFKQAGEIPSNVQFNKEWADHWNDDTFNAINQEDNRSNNNQIKYSNEFRRVQEAVRKGSNGGQRLFRPIEGNARHRLAELLKRELESQGSFSSGNPRVLDFKNRRGETSTFKIHSEVSPQIFHDFFEIVRNYTKNGELVDLHDDYSDCKCYINEDGTCGFAIEPDGNLVSVFNLGEQSGFLHAVAPYLIEQGATHLDAYNSSEQPLKEIYERVLGAKVASSMDYNMEYDHDNIAANHGNPEVVFMVMGEAAKGEVTEKHFTKDQYDEAVEYQKSYLSGLDALLPVEALEEPQRVSLPSYEYFMNKTEDTLVDASWKIPMLQELDKQISTELTPEENNEILDRMTRILEAKNQEDLLNLLSDEPKTNEKVEQNLTEFEKMTQQINNLLDSNIISASEIRHVAELVVNSISDTITILQKEEGAAEKFFPNIQTDLDFNNASRKEIVEAIGINNLIHRAKQQFDPEQNDYEDFDTIDQADLIIDNWDAIMTLAADTFAMTEGFGIMRNYDKGGFATTQNSTVDFDNFNDYSNDPDAMAESEKDEQEHWQVEQRTIDVLNSMSQMVRLALHECYQMDKEGNKVMSKWGIAERINPRQAVNSILRWTQGSLTLEDMIGKMQGKATRNPWLNQLIERLSNKSGKETDFQSQFFGVFSKHFQPYSVVLLEDGKYHSIPVNSHPALSEAMQTITTQFKIGEHPLFTDKGINRKLLGSDSTTDAKSPFNLHQALTALNTIQDRLQHGEQLDNAMSKEAASNIMGVCKVMGYPVTEEMLSDVINEENLSKMTKSLGFIVRSLDAAREEQFRNAGTPNAKVYNPFAFNSDNGIAGTLRNFLTPITDTLEDTAVSAFYDSGKMYQSYVTPSFMTKLMNKFRLEGQEFENFIMQEYGNTEWFKSAKNQWDINKGWRNEWLRLLATDENARKVFDHKVELNFNKHNYMRNMSDAEYTLSLITEYFAETGQKKEALVPAWFRVPIMSNKPSSEFIKFYSYRGANYKDEIIYGLHQMFNQELSRIQTVNMRNHSEGDADFIANFDTNGRKFNFLPFLNQFLEKSNTSELAKLLQEKINGLKALTAEEEVRLSTLVDQAIMQDMENRVATILSQWENSGIIEAAKNIESIGTEEAQIRANLENFLWNDNFASKNILQLTITDIAFYKDAEDLQKRLAQIHAPGIRGNVAATDYNGNRVSDGKYRTILIQGLQKFKTDLIANIAEVFDRKIAAAPKGQKAQLMALKESLVGENGRYTKIDVTDGQAYSSPSSYRKKAFIFGKWSRQAEDIYQKLLKGDYNYTDLEVAFQPLKPFVYTHLQKDMGAGNAPIHQMPVPFQAKNSEYLLIMADALLQGEKTSKPNILRAIYRVMEDSERLNPTKGIDTVQFDSAIKSGLQAPIDLNPFLNMEGGEEAAYEYMKRMIYKLDDQDNPSNEYATDTYVHEGLYEDYCLQQEVPEHFKNHSQAHGSQIRMITPSDLDFYKNPNADHNDPDNQVFYEWTEPDGTKKKLRADEFRREYEQTIADNIRESIDQLSQELHINSEDKKERNIALSKIFQREILSSPRYGIDLIQACSIDKETGEFRIPKGDPIQAKRIEQLTNSIIKNRVNKQKIAGGPIVQVTNFGASRQLHIRFNSKDGGLLMTREEYEQNPQKREMSQTDKFNARYGRKTASGNMTYEEYVKQNQAGIAYFEVFIPMWANEIFEKFSNEDGSINMEAIEATDPELLKMISYRIPTEDKYSCAPMKAVGFMPREAGDAIMFPYELTEIDDSDFDVDKRYVMRKDIPIVRKPKHIIHKELFNIVEDSYKKQHDGKELPANIASEIEVFLDSPDTMRSKGAFTKWLYSQYQKVAYTTEAPTSGRKYRDNKIVDMTWAVLTNEMTADKILNPGGFDVFKRAGYMVAAYKNPANNYSWEQLQQMSIDELNKLSYTDKDLTWLDTQIQFYKQNAAAASLIGVFAVNKVAHATLESNKYYVAVDEICGNEPFTIAGTEFSGRMKVDPSHDSEGNLIGKTIGAGVSASADAAKTPVLNLMNINLTTAGVFNTLLRLGMAPNDASLFMSQEVIERVLNEFNRENLTNYKPLSTIIEEHIGNLRDKHNIDDSSNINTEPLSREELVEGLTPEDHEVIDYKVLLAFQKIRSLVDAMRKPTFATRFNSVSSAVGPLIIDNLIMEHKMEQFTDAASEDGTHFYDSEGSPVDIDDIFYDHPILKEFSRTVGIAKVMFSDMPAGSTGFRELLATLPEGLTDKVYNDKKLLDNLSNFYQSYLLIASRMVNPANLKRFIDNFPKYFNDQKFKEKYADNALISAIRMNVSKRTGRTFLSINITGIDESQKEVYRNAWIDLHKDNPELSKQLFEYCFFRAGVGFSPKTFMSLVPAYVKERLSTDLGNGSQATYVDTYRMFPSVNPNVVIDQWVRNNWDNNKLVPKKGGEGTHYIVDLKRGTLVTRDPKDMADLKGNTYIKTRHNGQTYLWKQVIADKTAVNYVMVKPLGNNAEYLEMNLSDITKPMSETKETIEDMQESELQATSPAEAEAAETSNTDNTTDSEKVKQVAELADLIQKQNPKFNKTQALNQIERMKEKPGLYAGFLVNVYKQKGLNLTKEEALAEFKKLC